ncbi:hypothetical protein SAMN05421737_101119 [Shouchella lonarensis]|uniref:Uncharacterized protein n=1 Tax=Shouchella lonarensis TaxID=1464122 RepID=A0A1G6GIV9_9BACI|nr:hypothetical protein SAMN05421737_101119 [Shouchella lonarensis]
MDILALLKLYFLSRLPDPWNNFSPTNEEHAVSFECLLLYAPFMFYTFFTHGR